MHGANNVECTMYNDNYYEKTLESKSISDVNMHLEKNECYIG